MLIPVVHLEWVEWTTNQVLPYNKNIIKRPGSFRAVLLLAMPVPAHEPVSFILTAPGTAPAFFGQAFFVAFFCR